MSPSLCFQPSVEAWTPQQVPVWHLLGAHSRSGLHQAIDMHARTWFCKSDEVGIVTPILQMKKL